MENPYSDLVYKDYRKIVFETNTRPVEMTIRVARSVDEIENWIRECRPTVLGLDIEWKPMFDKTHHKASLLQLSCRDSVLLVQLFWITIPPAMLSLLEDENVRKVGVGICADAEKMLADWDIPIKGIVELGQKGVSLAKLAKSAIDIKLTKNKKICMSNWEKRHLTHAQVLYAALDAWVASESFEAISKGDPARTFAS
jgi:ribonuclease D